MKTGREIFVLKCHSFSGYGRSRQLYLVGVRKEGCFEATANLTKKKKFCSSYMVKQLSIFENDKVPEGIYL